VNLCALILAGIYFLVCLRTGPTPVPSTLEERK
jgi:hypothetical protein